MRAFFVIAITTCLLAACTEPELKSNSRLESLERRQREAAEKQIRFDAAEASPENVARLNTWLPRRAVGWNWTNDTIDSAEERSFETVRLRLWIRPVILGPEGLGEPCKYSYESPAYEGVILLQSVDGKTYRLMDMISSARPDSWVRDAYSLLLSVDSYGENPKSMVTIDSDDRARFLNFTRVLCPEDGEEYARAWMAFRFGQTLA